MKWIVVLVLLLVLLGCATAPKQPYSDNNPRFQELGIQQPYGGVYLIMLKDKETGQIYVIAAISGNGMTMIRLQ